MIEPEPETMESITAQGRHLFAAGDVWRCGCERRNERFFMCSFHEGFEAGLECVRTVPSTSENVEEP